MSKLNVENVKTQMRKGVLEYCILNILFEKEAYPSDIIAVLKESNLKIVEGTLYPLLTRLKNAGVLEYNWVESQSGPPRKYYTLTEEGKELRASLADTWDSLEKAVVNTKNHKNQDNE